MKFTFSSWQADVAKNNGLVLLIFITIWATGWAERWEDKTLDFVFEARHRFSRDHHPNPQLAFLGIDDQSLDPSYSPNSDLWNHGGWLTRQNWTLPLQFFTELYKPSVLSYDILFRPNAARNSDPLSDDLINALHGSKVSEGRKTVDNLESLGNDEIQKQLYDLADARQAGQGGPRVVMAVNFIDDPRGVSRLNREDRRADLAALEQSSFPQTIVAQNIPQPVKQAIGAILPTIRDSPVFFGPINVARDSDGVIRRVPIVFAYADPTDPSRTRLIPSFSFLSVLLQLGIEPQTVKPFGQGLPALSIRFGDIVELRTEKQSWRIPIDDQGRLTLNPRFTYREMDGIPYVDAADGGLALLGKMIAKKNGTTDAKLEVAISEKNIAKGRDVMNRIHEKLTMIGLAGTGVGDAGSYALDPLAPNTLAHQICADNLLRQDFVQPRSRWLTLAILVFMGLITWTCYCRLPAILATVVLGSLLMVVPSIVAIVLLLTQGVNIAIVQPGAELAVLFGVNVYHFYRHEAALKEQVRKMFSTMVSHRVLQLMEEDPTQFGLVGVRREATLFFSDLSGFTRISEKMAPTDLCKLLNRYFTPMTDLILEHDGYLKEYAGDGIVAAWGLPYPDTDHAWKAVQTALRQSEVLDRLSEEIFQETGIRLSMRIGINSGVVSAGNMGSARRFQYGMMGDAVNLAARLEPINKEFGTRIILSEFTRALVQDRTCTRFLDKIIVTGKSVPVGIYELIGLADKDEANRKWIEAYEQGFAHYTRREWDQAEAQFQTCRILRGEDPASQLLLSRVLYYRLHQPLESWQGEYLKTTKG